MIGNYDFFTILEKQNHSYQLQFYDMLIDVIQTR